MPKVLATEDERRHLLGEIMIFEKIIAEEQLQEALDLQASLAQWRPLGLILIDLDFIDYFQLVRCLKKQHEYRLKANELPIDELDMALDKLIGVPR